ncbi:MAG: hypothetical protein A2340_08870 [Lentisphaerae bacterium RIFOXYB12_FULL_60_10]|nr:MAG: hypothetical protein A2269_06570 [Lentisphaerae bacterium RIFOXYA12_FULL_60_10]OGV76280.1 MAG: hypothetical protein A2340_08870 [Lentisphaerae bacterium RIFOXYB12_FULL_60_10]
MVYAESAKKLGRRIVGLMCSYTPREIITASGAIPICLCGGTENAVPRKTASLPTSLCPLVKATYTFCVDPSNILMELSDVIVAETTLDAKKDVYDLMGHQYPVYLLELPHQSDHAEAFQHWVMELRKLKTVLEQRFHTTITRQRLRWALREMNRERELIRTMRTLMKNKTPPMTGRELINMQHLIACMPGDWDRYEAAIRTLRKRTPHPSLAGRVRVLLIGAPLPRVTIRMIDIVESRGGVVVCHENCTDLRPLTNDIDASADDPIVVIAQQYFHRPCSGMTPTDPDPARIDALAREYAADCVIDYVWTECKSCCTTGSTMKTLVEKDMGLPYLRIETDFSIKDIAHVRDTMDAFLKGVSPRRAKRS